jgi:anion-transporting  ArsA/GET3 family ATPase
MSGIERVLEGKEICICAGSGGVGKTTASAAIAAGMAARGRKVAVLTIDPAKRLADSLGLDELGNRERRVDPALFEQAGIDSGGGELWAMMLDAKATFDEVVREHAPDDATRDRILGNRIYQQISGALAGSQEYMAMEKLYELHREGRYDLLVLDTPPSRNAIDFLEAPKRLTQFIEGRSLQLFMRPTGLGMRVLGRGTSVVFAVLKRVTGLDLIEDLSEFFGAMSGMVGGFRERARRVDELLADERTTFVLVCGPAREPIEEAIYFHRRLTESDLPFGGAVVNRVHTAGTGEAAEEVLASRLALALGDADLAHRVAVNYRDYRALADRDARNIGRLERRIGADSVIRVPYLADDVHDIAGLVEVDRYLFAG